MIYLNYLTQYKPEKLRAMMPAQLREESLTGLWAERPYKDFTRYLVAKLTQPRRDKLFLMPSYHGRDIGFLKALDKTTPDAYWNICERDFKTLDQFRQNAGNLFSDEETIRYWQSEFSKTNPDPVDFAWFDLLSTLWWNDVYWLRDRFKISKDGDLFITLHMGLYRDYSTTHPINMLRYFVALEDGFSDAFFSEEEKNKIYDEWEDIVQGEYGDIEKEKRTVDDQLTIVAAAKIIRYFLNQDFDMDVFVYQDNVQNRMGVFRIYNREDIDEDSIDINESIDKIVKIKELWSQNISDKDIAESINVEEKTIKIWRAILRLPENAGRAEAIKENLFALLKSDESVKALPKNYTSILKNRLAEFNSYIQEAIQTKEVKISAVKAGIKAQTPYGSYSISVTDSTQSSAIEVREDFRHIVVIPQFLHDANRESLFSIFRLVFMGDAYLHPQLCGAAYDDCFIFSDPQKEALRAWVTSIQSGDKMGAIVLPTGMGKTHIALEVIQRFCETTDCKTLFISHRKEILTQTCAKFCGDDPYRLENTACLAESETRAKKISNIKNKKYVFALIQGFHNYANQFDHDSFDLIIIDEFHHARASTWENVIKKFIPIPYTNRGAKYLVGLTATPFRSDEKSVLEILDYNYIYKESLGSALWSGYLTTPKFFLYSDVSAEEYSLLLKDKKIKKQYEDRLQLEWIKKYEQNHLRFSVDTKTIAFCSSIEDAERWEKLLNKHIKKKSGSGFLAASYTSRTANREDILNAFKAGKIQCLVTVDLLDEGVDVPDVDIVMFLSKSESPVKLFQRIGRGLRLFPGKREVQIIDFLSNYDTYDKVLNLSIFMGDRNTASELASSIAAHGSERESIQQLVDNSDAFGIMDIYMEYQTNFVIRYNARNKIEMVWNEKKKAALRIRKQNPDISPVKIAEQIEAPTQKVIEWVGWGGSSFSQALNMAENAYRQMLPFGKQIAVTGVRNAFDAFNKKEVSEGRKAPYSKAIIEKVMQKILESS